MFTYLLLNISYSYRDIIPGLLGPLESEKEKGMQKDLHNKRIIMITIVNREKFYIRFEVKLVSYRIILSRYASHP